MNAAKLKYARLGFCLLIVLFTNNFISLCVGGEVSNGGGSVLDDFLGGGDDWDDGEEEEREREWMKEMRDMLQRADESRETEDEYRKLFSQNKETSRRTEASDTTTSPESTGLQNADYNWEKLLEQIEELEDSYYTEAPTLDEEEQLLEAENYEDVAETSRTEEFEVASADGSMEKMFIEENVTMMEKPNSNETVLLVEDTLQVKNETTNQIIYQTSNEDEVVLDEKIDVNKICTSPSDCKDDFFCPYWNYPSGCTKCKAEGDQCFDNRECCQDKEVAGYMRKGVCFLQGCSYQHNRGDIGVQCDSDRECNRNECCAFYPVLGTNFCTRLPKLGEQCLLNGNLYADTGLSGVIAHGCPACSNGLQCDLQTETCNFKNSQPLKKSTDEFVP